MYKAGLILGAVALFVAAGATLISPLCAPCASVFLGVGAGYLAAVFEKPSTNTATTKASAIGGAIGGVGAILGQIIGTVINASIVGPEGLQRIYQQLGVPTGSMDLGRTYWIGAVGGALCFSLLDVILMAGFGALGGLLWWQSTGKNAPPPAPTAVG